MPTASRDSVIKLDSGYNIGIRPENAEIEVISRAETLKVERKAETREVKEGLPLLSILSTGGTIASKVDYRTGVVSPQFSSEGILGYLFI